MKVQSCSGSAARGDKNGNLLKFRIAELSDGILALQVRYAGTKVSDTKAVGLPGESHIVDQDGLFRVDNDPAFALDNDAVDLFKYKSDLRSFNNKELSAIKALFGRQYAEC